MKKGLLTISSILIIFALTRLPLSIGGDKFTDLNGTDIRSFKDVTSIVSFSSTHTENLYFIGAGDLLVGTGLDSIYPYDAAKLPKFDIRKVYDLNNLIELNPGIVLVEPEIVKNNRKSVSYLESRGLNVINIMPQNLEEFDTYINQLGLMSGRVKYCTKLLEHFNKTLDLYLNNKRGNGKTAFVESSERGYKTPTNGSLIGQVFEFAGVNMLTPGRSKLLLPKKDVSVGFDYILENDSNIDSYFTLVGTGYGGSSLISISQKNEFLDLNSISSGRVYEIPGNIIDSYSFRLLDIIKDINRLVYGDDDYLDINLHQNLTRELFCRILYSKINLQTYFLDDNNYYEFPKYNHTYGAYIDVNYDHPLFNIIETVSMSAYILPNKVGDREFFDSKQYITKKDILHFLYIYKDYNRGIAIKYLDTLGLKDKERFTGGDLITILTDTKEVVL